MKGESRGWRTIWVALLLAAIHVALACGYAATAPYCTPGFTNGRLLPDIGAPDERAHSEYIDHICRAGLPVLETGPGRGEFDYEFHQPPLYYEMAFGWALVTGVVPESVSMDGEVLKPENGFRMRLMNCLIGGFTVLGVFFLALWTTGKRDLAILSGAFAGLLPMLCAVDGAVSMDPLIICLSTWVLALLAKWAGNLNPGKACLIIILLGAALLTKSTALLLIPVVALGSVFGGGKGRWVYGIAIPVAALAIASPWFLRNQALYGDPLGLNAFYATFQRDVFPAEVFSGLRPFAHWLYVFGAGTGLSFVGEFGYMDIHLPYAVYIPVLALLGLSLVRAAPVKEAVENRAVRLGFLGFVVLLLFGYLSYNLWQVQPQARYLFPAIGVLALWAMIGAGKWHRALPSTLLALLLFANVWALITLPGAFRERVDAAKEVAGQTAK